MFLISSLNDQLLQDEFTHYYELNWLSQGRVLDRRETTSNLPTLMTCWTFTATSANLRLRRAMRSESYTSIYQYDVNTWKSRMYLNCGLKRSFNSWNNPSLYMKQKTQKIERQRERCCGISVSVYKSLRLKRISSKLIVFINQNFFFCWKLWPKYLPVLMA